MENIVLNWQNIKDNNSEKEQFEKGKIWIRKSLGKDNSGKSTYEEEKPTSERTHLTNKKTTLNGTKRNKETSKREQSKRQF